MSAVLARVVGWLRQPTTLGGVAVLLYLALKHWLPAWVGDYAPVASAAVFLILVPDNTAGAAATARAVSLLLKLAPGAPPAP